MSKTLPCRTLVTPPTPSERSAPSMALPCGSRIPGLSVTVTRAFIAHCISMNRPRRNTGVRSQSIWGKAQRPRWLCTGLPPGRPTAGDGSSAFDQDRSGALRPLALAHDAKPLGNFGIGFDQSAQIAPEAVLVELFVRFDIPQPARIRGNLVRHDNAHQVIFPQPAGFHFKIDQPDADAEEQTGQEVVDADRK